MAAAGDAFDVIVYAEAGADLTPYLSNILAAKYVWPNGTQTYYGRLKAANLDKLASLPGVAAIEDLRYSGERPQQPDLGERRLNSYEPGRAGDDRRARGETSRHGNACPAARGCRGGLVRRPRRSQVQGRVGAWLYRPGREGARERHGNGFLASRPCRHDCAHRRPGLAV